MINLGNISISKAYAGNLEVVKVYLGSNEIYYFVQSSINQLKSRVSADGGKYESESYQLSTLNLLNL